MAKASSRNKAPLAIKTENLSKKYVISSKKRFDPKGTLVEKLTNTIKSTARNIGSLKTFQDQVSETKEEFYALQDISFKVREGEVLGLIGRNGAGKSTLLKLLCRITEPTRGRIRMRGRVASLLEVGTGFHPELSGRENVYLNGAILGMTRKEISRKFDDIIDFAGVEQFIDTPVKRYSSGMFVRLAFSVAAHLEPEILLVDEVLAVGDVAFQRKCMGKMNEVAEKSGRTIIFVSHNMTSIQKLCNRALFLEKGRLFYDGHVKEAVDRYLRSNSQEAGKGTNLRLRPRSKFWKLTELTLDTCLVINSKGESNAAVNFGESFSLHLEFIAEQNVDQFTVQVSIDNQTHVRIATLNSSDVQQSFSCKKGNRIFVQLQLGQLMLAPGLYDISIQANHINAPIDRLDQAITMEILQIPEADLPVPHHRPGVLMPLVEWSNEQSKIVQETKA